MPVTLQVLPASSKPKGWGHNPALSLQLHPLSLGPDPDISSPRSPSPFTPRPFITQKLRANTRQESKTPTQRFSLPHPQHAEGSPRHHPQPPGASLLLPRTEAPSPGTYRGLPAAGGLRAPLRCRPAAELPEAAGGLREGRGQGGLGPSWAAPRGWWGAASPLPPRLGGCGCRVSPPQTPGVTPGEVWGVPLAALLP